jgi:DNA-binding protein H-NS
MATLAAIKRQIAALEAEAARITKVEMGAAIGKIKELMTSFGITGDHLGLAGHSAKPVGGPKKSVLKKATAKRAGAGTPKYADPKSGKTWTGFGRAPGWIAEAKNRDDFLVTGASSPAAEASEPKPAKSPKKVAAKAKPAVAKKAVKVAKAATKRAVSVAKKSVASDAAPVVAKKATKKSASAKKAVAKKSPAAKKEPAAKKMPSAKKVVGKKAVVRKAKSAAAAATGAGATAGDGSAAPSVA